MADEEPKRSPGPAPAPEEVDPELARVVATVVRTPLAQPAKIASDESDLDRLLRELAQTPAIATAPPGQPFAGTSRFHVLRRLGEGGFGVVYLVRDVAIGADVALKTLPVARAELVYRLKREFRTLADLRHENLASFYELFADAGTPYFTMEYVAGRTFLDHVRRDGAVDEHRLRSALAQLARGLTALHRAGKLHRDLKPSNVLVSEAGRVVILDFGLATDIDEGGTRRSVALAGTPGYMPPEHGAGAEVSAASDWYSVGVMLHEALTGKLPSRAPRDPRAPGPIDPLARVPAGTPADLVALCRRLLSPRPEDRPTGPDIAAALGPDVAAPPPSAARAREPPLVGRERELQLLGQALATVRAGRGVTALVEGSSGAGKTALVQHFLARAERSGDAAVLRGRCYERERVPYQGIDSLVDDLCRLLQRRDGADALVPRHVAALVRLFPVLERVPAIADAVRAARGSGGDEQQLRHFGFGALRELLARIADREPLILHIDDLQWGDLDTAALLHELARPPDAPAMLLVLSFREEDRERSPCLRALADGTLGELVRVEVGPLEAAAAEELARRFLRAGQTDVDPGRLAAEAGGNPFFILELARFAEGVSASEGGPPDLEGALRARVAGLPIPARQLLEVVALAGHPITEEVARAAAGIQGPPWEAWGVLVGGHFIRFSGAHDDRHVEPLHDRIREAVARALPPERVLAGHRGLAAALEAAGDGDPEVLARHHEAAGDVTRAFRAAVTAAAQAEQALAFDRAARLFRWALRLAPDGADREGLLSSVAAALAHAGRGVEAAEAYLEAALHAAPAEQTALRREAALQLLISGRVDEGREVALDALRGVGVTIPRTPRSALASLLAHTAMLWARGLRFVERPAAEIPRDVRERMDHLWALSRGFSMIDVLRGAEFAARHLLLALSSGEPHRVAMGLAVALAHAGTSAPRAQRTRHIEASLDALDARLGDPLVHGYAMVAKTIHGQGLGDWPATLARARVAERAIERCTGAGWEIWTTRVFHVSALFYLGRWRELPRTIDVHLADARDRGNVYAMVAMRAPYGVLAWAVRGDMAEARRQLDDAAASWSVQGFHLQHYWLLIAESYLALLGGDAARAFARLRERWPELERSLVLRIPFARAELLHARGACAAAAALRAGEPAARRRLLADAARCARDLERAGAEMARPLASLLRAAVASQEGGAPEAKRQLAAAVKDFDAQRMAAHAAAARVRLAELEGAPVPAFLPDEGVADPAAFVAMLAPGFMAGARSS
jgi:eukaryotic-like serine/threonine-protein kinase